jgi:hypothetical protein
MLLSMPAKHWKFVEVMEPDEETKSRMKLLWTKATQKFYAVNGRRLIYDERRNRWYIMEPSS